MQINPIIICIDEYDASALLTELHSILDDAGIADVKTRIELYPALHKLIHLLENRESDDGK